MIKSMKHNNVHVQYSHFLHTSVICSYNVQLDPDLNRPEVAGIIINEMHPTSYYQATKFYEEILGMHLIDYILLLAYFLTNCPYI